MGANIEILCTACGADALLRREPVYEGLRKTGEKLRCGSCGHEFPDEASVPFKARKTPSVFGAEDRVKTIRVFREGEGSRNCRHCEHYVVNPFIQRCGLHHREIQSTDLCNDFSPKKVSPPQAGAPVRNSDEIRPG